MGTPTGTPDQMMQSMWNPAASRPSCSWHSWTFCGSDPQFQQQMQSQAQISALQQQNALLNQQLATQAASHIHQLQPFLQHPTPHPPSSAPSPQVLAPSEPPLPKAHPEV